MTPNAPPTPPGGPVQEKQALLEAFDDVLKADAERRAAEAAQAGAPDRGPRIVTPVAAVGLLTLAMLLTSIFVTRPPWMGFPDGYVEPPVVQDASLRLSIYHARQRVEQYRSQYHALPATLDAAGVSDPALRMTVVSGSLYVIEGGNDSISLALRSDEPVRPFLGDAYNVIAGGRTR